MKPRTYADLQDVSLRRAAQITKHSPETLRPIWPQIPTAYITESGRYYVSIAGLRQWTKARGQR